MKFSGILRAVMGFALATAPGAAITMAQATPQLGMIIIPASPKSARPASAVVKLAQAGVGTNVVIAYIDSSAAPFGMTAEEVVNYKASGVSPEVLTAMLRHDAQIVQHYLTNPPATVISVTCPANEAPLPPLTQGMNETTQEPLIFWGGGGGGGWFTTSREDHGRRPDNYPRHQDIATQTVPSIPGTVSFLQPTIPTTPHPVSPVRSTPRYNRPAAGARNR
jgi:hypothetical protein